MYRPSKRFVCILCICISVYEIFALSWHNQKVVHRLETLDKENTELVVKLGDGKSDHFKNDVLKPFLRSRVSGSVGNLQVQQHIRQMMSGLGWTIEEDSFVDDTPFGRKNFTNIIATQNPRASRRLVLACHFDSKFFEKFEFIGATDSAVPCAMIIDLAYHLNKYLDYPQMKIGQFSELFNSEEKYLRTQTQKETRVSRSWFSSRSHHVALTFTLVGDVPHVFLAFSQRHCLPMEDARDISLELLFFDGEEAFVTWSNRDSLYGARHLARKISTELLEVDREIVVSRLDTIDVLVLLDLIGTSDTMFTNYFTQTSRLYNHLHGIESRLMSEGLLDSGRPLFRSASLSQQRYPQGIQDDHIPFLQKGVPVLHLISDPFPSVWHSERDNESSLDYQRIDRLAKILRVFVVEYLHTYLDV